jgi:2-methylcitrate dehydratase PrpD
MSGNCNIDPIVKDLQTGTENLALYHAAMKRFPVNASQHSPIELLDHLARTHNIDPRQVTKIRVEVNEGILLHGGTIYQPKEVIEAQFSLRFSLALRLLKGNNDLQHYLDPAMWSDRAILEIGKKIELLADPTATGPRRFACQMSIQISDGREVRDSLAAPKGSYKNPLTPGELQDKFHRLGRTVLDDERLRSIVASVERIEKAQSVVALSSLMTAT